MHLAHPPRAPILPGSVHGQHAFAIGPRQLPPLPRRKIPEFQTANASPDQAQHRIPHARQHSPDLTVFSSINSRATHASGTVFLTRIGRIAGRHHGRWIQCPRPARQGGLTPNLHAVLESVENFPLGQPLNLCPVETRMTSLGRQQTAHHGLLSSSPSESASRRPTGYTSGGKPKAFRG